MGTPNPADAWSNQKCIEIALSDHFPACVKELNIQKDVITRYLDFYLGGKLPKGLTVTDVAFAVISIMPLHESTEQFIWDPEHYKDTGTLFVLTRNEDDEARKVGKKNVTTDNQMSGHVEKKTEQSNNQGNNEYFEPKADFFNDNVDSGQNSSEDNNCKSSEEENSEDTNEESEEPKPSCSRENPGTGRRWAPVFPSDLRWYKRMPKKGTESNRPVYEHLENSAFISSCNKLLNEWSTNTKGRIVIKYFFGIVALILMRATTKKHKHLKELFSSSKFLSMISFGTNHLNYCIPNKRCIKSSFKVYKKRNGKIPIMFAKIIVNSFRVDALRKALPLGSTPKLNIFKFTLLAHTADYGLGLVSVLQNLETAGADINRIAVVTFCKETADSWDRLKRFSEKYLTTKSRESTHHWARVVNTDYFSELSCKANLELAVILAVFIEGITMKSDIWKAEWVSGDTVEAIKERGRRMYSLYTGAAPSPQPSNKQEARAKSHNDGFPSDNPLAVDDLDLLLTSLHALNEFIDLDEVVGNIFDF